MKQLPILNPLPHNFSVRYDINNDKVPVKFTAISGEITWFDEPVAVHIAKHLVDELMVIRQKVNSPENRKEIEKEVMPINELADW